jgi:glycine C-acetyltransferase
MAYVDLFDKCQGSDGYFGEFRAMGDRYYTLPMMESVPGRVMRFQGKDNIMWSVNNYLGLAENEEIKKVAVETAKEWGISGPMGARMMSGTTKDHIELEEALAKFAQKESSILFNYGYMGVQGTIAPMVGPDDEIIMDKLCHASIVDGVFVSRAKFRLFRHNDMNSLERELKKVNENRKGGILILTEGVYGMTGDLAKMDEIAALKDKYEARLFVDDAHGVGVMGEHGRGIAEHYGVQDKIDLYFGTFAKAFAAIGGFTASNKQAVEWIRYNARTQVFAKSMPMVFVRALKKTLELVENGHDRRKRLFEVADKLRKSLREIGFYVGDVDSPIVPVFIPNGDPRIAMDWIKFLRDRGIFLTGVTYPVIPRGLILFRMIPTASHTDEDVEKTAKAFKELREERKLQLEMDPKMIKRMYGQDE